MRGGFGVTKRGRELPGRGEARRGAGPGGERAGSRRQRARGCGRRGGREAEGSRAEAARAGEGTPCGVGRPIDGPGRVEEPRRLRGRSGLDSVLRGAAAREASAAPQGWREGIVEADGPLWRMVRGSGPEGQDAVWGPFQSEAWLVASSAVHEPSAGVSEGPV